MLIATRKYAWLALTAVVSAWLLYVAVGSTSFQKCTANKENEQPKQPTKENSSEILGALIVSARVKTDCTFVFLYDSREATAAIATAFIAIFTFSLWRSTDRLWEAGEKQIAIAAEAAMAATKSAEVSEKALTATQRAMVIMPGLNTVFTWQKDSIVLSGIQTQARWENTGVTPALKLETWLVIASKDISDQTGIEFDMRRLRPTVVIGSVLGPKAPIGTGKILTTLNELVDVFEKRKRLFVYSRVEYDDVFEGTPRHHTEVCAEMLVVADPRTIKEADVANSNSLIDYRIHESYNSAN